MCSPCGSGPVDAGGLHGHRLHDVLAFGMPPEHDHAMLGPQLQGSNPRRFHDRFASIRRSRASPVRFPTRFRPRSPVVAISVGSGSPFPFAADVDPRSGHAHDRHRRVGEEPPRVDHQGGVRTQRFGLETGDPVRPVDRRPSGVARLPGTADTAEQRIAAAVLAAARRRGIASHRSATYLWGIPRLADRSRRRHRPATPGASVTCRSVSAPPADRPPAPRSRNDEPACPCTNILRTMCDLGAVDRHAVSGAVGHVLTLASGDAAPRSRRR